MGEIYDREINGMTVDVYDVLEAFDVRCPARQHAIKKLLCAGSRQGGKGVRQDLREAILAIRRAIELECGRIASAAIDEAGGE